MAKDRIRRVWYHMLQRCNNPEEKSYKYYGARGIKVCNEWRDFETFRAWAFANGYSSELSIDRIDNNGDYCPENCRWATDIQQANNKSNNRCITYDGKTMTCAEWARYLGINGATIRGRLDAGWDAERILTEPVGERPDWERFSLDAEEHTLREWEKILGLNTQFLCRRVKKRGMTLEEAIKKPKRGEDNLISFDGRSQSLPDWAEEIGIPYDTLRCRLNAGWTIEDAFQLSVGEKPANSRYNLFTYDGKTQTLTEWAREFSISYSAVMYRINELGWDVERALTTPREEKPMPYEERLLSYNGETKTLAEWSKTVGISVFILNDRVNKKGWSAEKALSQPVRNRQDRYLTLRGVTKSIKEWSADTGIPVDTIRSRVLKYGWDTESALTIPASHKNRVRNQPTTDNALCG